MPPTVFVRPRAPNGPTCCRVTPAGSWTCTHSIAATNCSTRRRSVAGDESPRCTASRIAEIRAAGAADRLALAEHLLRDRAERIALEAEERAAHELDPVEHVDTFWFAWSTYQPDTALIEG